MAGQGGFQTILCGTTNFPLSSTAEIAEVISISLPELSMTDIDISSMDSASNYMEFIGGSIDPDRWI